MRVDGMSTFFRIRKCPGKNSGAFSLFLDRIKAKQEDDEQRDRGREEGEQ
jgi:hypothetical protein